MAGAACIETVLATLAVTRGKRVILTRGHTGEPGFRRENERAALCAAAKWAIVDSNHGPPPYQSGALTN